MKRQTTLLGMLLALVVGMLSLSFSVPAMADTYGGVTCTNVNSNPPKWPEKNNLFFNCTTSGTAWSTVMNAEQGLVNQGPGTLLDSQNVTEYVFDTKAHHQRI